MERQITLSRIKGQEEPISFIEIRKTEFLVVR